MREIMVIRIIAKLPLRPRRLASSLFLSKLQMIDNAENSIKIFRRFTPNKSADNF